MSDPELEPALPSGTRRWYQWSLRTIFVVTTVVAILLAAGRALGSRLQFLLLAWVIAIPILLALGPKACDPSRRRWGFACGVALATVYGPFVVAALNTWLFDGTNTWLRVRFSYYLWLVPGGMLIELPFVTIWHQHSPLSPAFAIPFAGLLSAMVVAVAVWLIANAPRARWVLLPLLASFFAWGALVLDAGLRM
jgi:hypothetical protein